MLTLTRRAATAVLSAALTVGVVSMPAAQAAPVAPASAVAQQATAAKVDIPYFVAPTRKAGGELVARVERKAGLPQGQFKVVVKKGKKVVVRKSAKLVGGRATVTLPKLTKGKHKLVVRYSGDAHYSKGVARRAFKVA
ncbi:Ig-like domain repeat protein [Nocardioides caldifontis]|uniref:Ig-like domain repeat protein n=1 Tax=Nocardioides caldifontis TaxID=2588938 RepID=UPI0011DFAA8E|nr:Ig-like domain repeat protein [Nocardioides caldifontis]